MSTAPPRQQNQRRDHRRMNSHDRINSYNNFRGRGKPDQQKHGGYNNYPRNPNYRSTEKERSLPMKEKKKKVSDISQISIAEEKPPESVPEKTPQQEVDSTKTQPSSVRANEFYCLTCCERINNFSMGKCNHRDLCDICCLRMRVLFKDKKCCICKETLDEVIFTKEASKPFEDFKKDILQFDRNNGVYFEDPQHRQQIDKYWDLQCPKCSAPPFHSRGKLQDHVKNSHNLYYCSLCLHNRKVFLFEQKLYTAKELRDHLAISENSASVHPQCKYCETQFFDEEELYYHFNMAHITCYLCEAENIQFQYFNNYDHLESHFNDSHFLCKHPVCLEKKFVVFKSELDLKGHRVSVHRNSLSREEERGLRKIELNFSVRRANPITGQGESESITNSNMFQPPIQLDRAITTDSSIIDSRNTEVSNTTTTTTSSTVPSNTTSTSNPRNAPSLTEIIRNVKNFLGEHKFKVFRDISRDFNANRIAVNEYYTRFLQLFGRSEKSFSLFEDLLNTVPDPKKKEALTRLHFKNVKRDEEFPELKRKNKSSEGERLDSSEFPVLGGNTSANRPNLHLATYSTLLRPNSIKSEDFPTLPGAHPTNTSTPTNSVWDGKKKKKGNRNVISWG
eukprot:TRINITY_DN10385_c0_g1_i1.p1 TRINITY_DN10385_c0_g1~~TRINITY_DN10385_c0_g1_i1.p1  ORF type:complete len:644 (-),score=90.24 TRINITY_DN10385_c0_g1_i1:93-1952(-)